MLPFIQAQGRILVALPIPHLRLEQSLAGECGSSPHWPAPLVPGLAKFLKVGLEDDYRKSVGQMRPYGDFGGGQGTKSCNDNPVQPHK